jgi:hypothetical protein
LPHNYVCGVAGLLTGLSSGLLSYASTPTV